MKIIKVCVMAMVLFIVAGNASTVFAEEAWKTTAAVELKKLINKEIPRLDRDSIRAGYEHSADTRTYGRFALEDMNGDGVPELLLEYSIVGGGGKEVLKFNGSSYKYIRTFESYTHTTDSIVKFRNSQSNKTEFLNVVQFWTNYAAEDSVALYDLNSNKLTEWLYRYEDLDRNGHPTGGTYKVNGQNASKAEYDRAEKGFTTYYFLDTINYYPLTADGLKLAGLNANASTGASSPKIVINGKAVNFKAEPVTIDGSIFVEMRSLFETLGFKVDYNAKTRVATASKGNIKLEIDLGGQEFENVVAITDTQSNDKYDININPRVALINSRTMLPLRSIGELLNYKVDWNANTRTATLSANDYGTGVYSVKTNGVTANNELIITSFYYDAGRNSWSGSPSYITDKSLPARNIAISDKARIQILNLGELKTVSLADFKKSIQTFEIYEIKVENGKITEIKQVYMA